MRLIKCDIICALRHFKRLRGTSALNIITFKLYWNHMYLVTILKTLMYAKEYFGKYPMKEIHLSFCFRLPQDQLTIDGAPNFRQVKLHLLKRWR